MSDKNLYQWMPDSETLRRFYEGKLNTKEQADMTAMLEKDEFMREAFANLTAKEFNVVENISLSINDRLRKIVGRPPFHMRWQIWLSIFIGLIFITGFVVMKDWEDGKLVSENKGKKNKEQRTKNKEQRTKNKDKEHTNGKVSNEMKLVSTNETTMMFDSKNTDKENKLAVLKTKDSVKNEKKILVENTNDLPVENKVDQKIKDNKVDNPTTIDPGKKTYKLRVEDVAVLQLENLAEMEANAGEDRQNMDVRNVNIGDPVSNKKNNSYNLEDMPQYKGGNESLAAYVKGKIATKSYTLKESSVSTVVEFIVNSKGKVNDIKFHNSLDASMEKDIREVLTNLTFSPGKKSGKKGSMVYRMAMMFD